VYQQQDRIPDTSSTTTMKGKRVIRGANKDNFYMLPDPDFAAVLRALKKDGEWKYNPSLNIWTRSDGKVWYLILLFRLFRKDTNQYVEFRLNEGLAMAIGANPNDLAWVMKYRKWVRQISRRSTGVKVTKKDHWTSQEHDVIKRAINAEIRVKGLQWAAVDKVNFAKSFLDPLLIDINLCHGRTRNKAAVESMLNQQFKKSQGYIVDVAVAAKAIKARLDAGEAVPSGEQCPEKAISVSDLLADGDDEEAEDDEADAEAADMEDTKDQLMEEAIRQSREDVKRKRDADNDDFDDGFEGLDDEVTSLPMKKMKAGAEAEEGAEEDRDEA
jgi:hypothetical protein